MADSMVSSVAKEIGTVGQSWVSTPGGGGYNDTWTQFSASNETYRELGRNWVARQNVAISSGVSSGARANEQIGFLPTRPTVSPDSLIPSRAVVVGMHKWAGEIIAIDDEVLTAELVPLDQEGPTFTADFDRKLLGPDNALAKPGGTVYLTTRFIQDQSGYPEAMTNLRLRRPRRWSARELADTMRRARATAAAIQRHAG